MKTTTNLTAILLTFIIILVSCDVIGERGNGNVVKQERKVGSFHAIEVSGAFDVYLSQGTSQMVIVETDDNLQPLVRTEVHGGTLSIDTKGPFHSPKSMNIYITVTDLDRVELSGAVDLKTENRLTLTQLDIEISGATDANVDLAVQKLGISSSGGSKMKFSGMANKLDLDVSGAADIHAYDLQTEIATVSISGAGEAELNVSKELSAEVSGAATVRYKGDPAKVDTDVSGAGSVRKAS